jgi:hypothetical protein
MPDMMGVPIYYDQANMLYNSVNPTGVQVHDNTTAAYYTRYLLKRAMAMLELKIPKAWNAAYFKYVLYAFGYVGIIDSSRYGVIPQQCTLSGYDVFYSPAKIIVTNPLMTGGRGNGTYRIGSNCEIIKLQPDLSGVVDICQMHATRLALMHEALEMNLANSKLAYVFTADTKARAATLSSIFDEIQSGKPAVVGGAGLIDPKTGNKRWEAFSNNLKQNYIAVELLQNMRQTLNDFDSFLGIPSANQDKRERMVEAEVTSNRIEADTLLDVMYNSVKDGIERVNAMFGDRLGGELLAVSKRYNVEEVQTDGEY